MPGYKPPSISDIGLKKHLDDSAAEHGGNGYDEFVESMKTLSKFKIATKFKVNRRTLDKWVEVYLKEKRS